MKATCYFNLKKRKSCISSRRKNLGILFSVYKMVTFLFFSSIHSNYTQVKFFACIKKKKSRKTIPFLSHIPSLPSFIKQHGLEISTLWILRILLTYTLMQYDIF